jgi:hypothetical protein
VHHGSLLASVRWNSLIDQRTTQSSLKEHLEPSSLLHSPNPSWSPGLFGIFAKNLSFAFCHHIAFFGGKFLGSISPQWIQVVKHFLAIRPVKTVCHFCFDYS